MTDLVDVTFTDEMLYKFFISFEEVEIPIVFQNHIACYASCYPLILKVHYDHFIPGRFTKLQSEAIASLANQLTLASPNMTSLQRQYKAYLKELWACESRLVSNSLKDVLYKAQVLLQIDPVDNDPLFRTFPFRSLTPSQQDPCSFQQWCIEILLVATLNIQPTFDPQIHTQVDIPSDSNAVLSPPISVLCSHCLDPRRNWLSTLPHTDPIVSPFNRFDCQCYPWFMFDSLLQVITEVVFTTYSTLCLLCEEDSKQP
jgi:hypothetical protein